jgi:phosphoribosylanthranilate isomerase
VLLESARSGYGEPADWDEARAVSAGREVVLAGGLTVDNVAAAVRAVRPFGVDVSSGVESSRGVKDPKLIRQFVAAAREAGALGTVA